MIPLRHRSLWSAASAVLVVAIVYASLAPDVSPPVPRGFDKLEHFATYCGLAVWFTGLYPRARYLRVIVGLLALGLGVEIAQGLMKLGRAAEALDMAANAAGLTAGLLLAISLTGNWARRVESWLQPRE